MARRTKRWVSYEDLKGAEVVSVEPYSPVVVRLQDGRLAEIVIEIGHDGAEMNAYEVSER